MKLGMIVKTYGEEAFAHANALGLDFVEYCVNGADHGEELLKNEDHILRWMEQYKVGVGSIGRWKSEILRPDGTIDPQEIALAQTLLRLCKKFNCPNYVCGCNYIDAISLYENYSRAIQFFTQVLDAAPASVKVSVYNCRKMNFINTEEAWRIVLGHLPALGIKFDPSHSRYADSDYLQELVEWGSRVYHVHLKGSMIIGGQRVDDPPAGLDQTDWRSVLNILRAKGYDRNLSVEPHSPVWQGELGEKGLAYTIRYFRDLML